MSRVSVGQNLAIHRQPVLVVQPGLATSYTPLWISHGRVFACSLGCCDCDSSCSSLAGTPIHTSAPAVSLGQAGRHNKSKQAGAMARHVGGRTNKLPSNRTASHSCQVHGRAPREQLRQASSGLCAPLWQDSGPALVGTAEQCCCCHRKRGCGDGSGAVCKGIAQMGCSNVPMGGILSCTVSTGC